MQSKSSSSVKKAEFIASSNEPLEDCTPAKPSLDHLSKEELLDLLTRYDEYIQEANDDDRYSDGWYPVCLNEFYDCEYQMLKSELTENQPTIVVIDDGDVSIINQSNQNVAVVDAARIQSIVKDIVDPDEYTALMSRNVTERVVKYMIQTLQTNGKHLSEMEAIFDVLEAIKEDRGE